MAMRLLLLGAAILPRGTEERYTRLAEVPPADRHDAAHHVGRTASALIHDATVSPPARSAPPVVSIHFPCPFLMTGTFPSTPGGGCDVANWSSSFTSFFSR